ncbi:pentatricopeptide repeat-containing protein At5g48910 [Rutidosis leptorrhynchoides]|uniref:pentatricopeptide repeat-containing protein At5g48910 n=1 Tax=Rutidosis leptorrhynchoides TaxID=125765 RepID=UPI003A992E31
MNSTVLQSTSQSTHPSTFFPEFKQCKTKRDVIQIHAKLIKTGRIRDPLASAELIRFYALSDPQNRDIRYARQVFDEMPQPNCFSWNTLIRAFCDTDDTLESLHLFKQMVEFVQPNKFTFPSVLKACAKTGRIEEGKQMHCVLLKLGLDNDEFVLSNLVRMYAMCGAMDDAYMLFDMNNEMESDTSQVVLWNVMVDGYLRLGEVENARTLFDEMPQRSVVSWNSMISGYAQNGCFVEALELFREMQMEDDDGVTPNYITLVSVLLAVSSLGALEIGRWVHFYAVKNSIKIDPVLGSALIDMYSKCGSINEALQLFNSLSQKNVITWNSIITGLAIHGRANDALELFTKMQQSGILPNDVTYISVLTACSHSGLVDKGVSIFNQMVCTEGLVPRLEHYGCMVDSLGRAGRLQDAEKLILEMDEPDDVALKALLGACKKHGNIEIGERVGKRLLEINPEDGAPYVALSNMYASMANWDRVAETRLKMKQHDVQKDPGCSWIEVDGVIHEFVVADESHTKTSKIYMMLEEMSEKLSLCGYKPDTTQVHLRMDDETDKESVLRYHSEKIAVAFGLISTSRKTTVKVVKNLRICDDCHSTIKHVSRIYGRRIVVRDRKRFHHFENGSCSCMDYW